MTATKTLLTMGPVVFKLLVIPLDRLHPLVSEPVVMRLPPSMYIPLN